MSSRPPHAQPQAIAAAERMGPLALFRLFRQEQTNPRALYEVLAERAASSIERQLGPLAGQRVADVGCGPGWYTAALRGRGADVLPIDYSEDELALAGDWPEGAIVGDAMDLPLADANLDGVFSSNMLEHVPDHEAALAEFVRVLRPGGWAYVSWTNWYSPWGGHEQTPFHYLGPELGQRVYERRHGGRAPKHVVGETLFPVHIGPVLRFLRSRRDLDVLQVEPRYWPRLRPVMRVPVLREVASWNCVVYLRKRGVAAA